MKNPYPAPLPNTLYVVTPDRVRAGKPPIVVQTPKYSGEGPDDRNYVYGKGSKFSYRIERCFETPELALKEIDRIGESEIASLQTRLSSMRRKVRQSRDLTAALGDDSPSP